MKQIIIRIGMMIGVMGLCIMFYNKGWSNGYRVGHNVGASLNENYQGCTINGYLSLYGPAKVTDCTFNVPTDAEAGVQIMPNTGSISMSNCYFKFSGDTAVAVEMKECGDA